MVPGTFIHLAAKKADMFIRGAAIAAGVPIEDVLDYGYSIHEP
jgi:hypothetical protein